MAFCRSLPERCGVVGVPNEVFYARPEHGRHLVRFACCKRLEVLDEAAAPPGVAVVMTGDAAHRRDPARHRVERPRRQLRAPRPDDRAPPPAPGPGWCCCTETFSTGFAVDEPDLGEPEGGPSSTFLADQAREHGVWVGGSCPEIPPARPPTTSARTTASCSPGRTARCTATARSTRSPSAARRSTSAPATDFVTVDIEGLRVSLFVCYDLRFADEFWQLAADTDVYLVPANWPAKRRLHWQVAAAGAGDREPGLRRRRQPGRRGRRPRLLRRQPHRRPARRAAGHRGADRDDPARRRLRRHTSPRPATTSASSRTAAEPVSVRISVARATTIRTENDGERAGRFGAMAGRPLIEARRPRQAVRRLHGRRRHRRRGPPRRGVRVPRARTAPASRRRCG